MTTETITTTTVIEENEINISISPDTQIDVSIAWPGPQGPAGPGTGATEFVFSTPQATWTVHHNFGRKVIAEVIGSANDSMIGSIEYPDLNTVVVTHAAPTTGSVLVL